MWHNNNMKTPDYITTEDFSIYNGFSDSIKLPAGSFVRPLSLRWVPKHVIEDPMKNLPDGYVYCFCVNSIYPIPKKIIREK